METKIIKLHVPPEGGHIGFQDGYQNQMVDPYFKIIYKLNYQTLNFTQG
jgi:hypothetical protein